MKKLLFCAGVLALAASCTEELDTLSVQQGEQAAGITFTAVAPQDDAATRGEFEEGTQGGATVWYPFWSAETDMIKVYANSVKKGALSFDAEELKTTNTASYKATRSERNAYFTASNQADILDFADGVTADAPATFLAVYPNTIELSADVTPDWKKGFDVTLSLGSSALSTNQTQTNTEGKGIYELNAKYAVTTGYPEADNKVAVGENVPLHFNRVLSGLVFRTKGVDAYTDKDDNIFGKLTSIEVTTLGEYKDGKAVTSNGEPASELGYGANSTVTVAVAADGTSKIKSTDFKSASTSTTMTLNLNLDWTDDARGYMIIKPVERVDADNQPWNEGIAITYTFENIEFTVPLETSNSWEANTFIPVPALDINSYPWLVAKSTAYNATGLTLILNEGADFDKIYKDGKIAWNWDNSGTPATTVDAANITRIISNIDLTDAQLQTIGEKFTGLTVIEYNEETYIPEGAFASQAATIEKLVMPKVTEIDPKFTNDGSDNQALAALTELNLESYTFPSTAINYLLFKGMETGSNNVLERLNMKAVKDMTAEFNTNRTISFQGFTKLTTVEMGENVIASQKAFKGCTNLVTINGSIDLNTANAVEAFMNAGTVGTYDPKKPELTFSTINITSDEIPADAFNGAKNMVNVLKDGKQVVPTYIGKRAFQLAENLQYMDLSKAATIGENAFAGASKYVGVSGTARLDVNAATIESGILAGTAVVNVYFTNATKVNGPIFYGDVNGSATGGERNATALEQVEFAKQFTAATLTVGGWDYAFSNRANQVDLFIQDGQQYYDRDNANVLALPEITGSGTSAVQTTNNIVFKSIKERDAAE